MEADDLDSISEAILDIPEVKECIDEAKAYHSNPSQQCLFTGEQTNVRGSQETMVLYTAIDDADMIQYKVPHYEGLFNQKTDTSFMQSVFEFASVAVLGDFLFVAGGYNRGTWCSSPAFYNYNPRNRLWAQLSSMQQPRVSFPLCPSEKGLYAVAGIEHIVMDNIDREIIINHVEFYNPEVNLWQLIADLPMGCFSVAAAVVDEQLYVSGGISDDPEDNVPVNYLNVYSPGAESWTPKARMLNEHQSHGMIGHQGKLYVFGGYTSSENAISFRDSHRCEVYDIETDQWTRIADSPKEYHHFHNSLAENDGKIFILGGKIEMITLHTFDIKEGKFTEDVEQCGTAAQKIVKLRVALPLDVM